MTLILDAGAFLAVERADREVVALIKAELLARRIPKTHGGVVGQVWRGGRGKQVGIARLLAGVEVVALDDQLGRRIGILLGRATRADAIDAGVVLLAADRDTILTSDAADLRALAASAAVHVDLVSV